MIEKADIIGKMRSYLQEEILQIPDREIAPDEPLISSGLIDSFSLVDVALFVEETFAIHIDDTELNAETFDSLDELAKIIQARQEGS